MVENPSTRFGALIALGVLACVEGGSLAISAGAPVTAAVGGKITICGEPVSGAQVTLGVQQDHPEQARPVNALLGPVTTNRDGSYFVEVAPPFAVPGAATVELRVSSTGNSVVTAGTLNFTLGISPHDTLRLDADLGLLRGSC
jgi:hypothetical protein